MLASTAASPLPVERRVALPEAEANYWLIVAPEQPVDLCSIDPAHDVDLLVAADLKAMISAWMGLSDVRLELRAGGTELHDHVALSSSFTRWIGRSGLACKAPLWSVQNVVCG